LRAVPPAWLTTAYGAPSAKSPKQHWRENDDDRGEKKRQERASIHAG